MDSYAKQVMERDSILQFGELFVIRNSVLSCHNQPDRSFFFSPYRCSRNALELFEIRKEQDFAAYVREL
jgi:hypothetical protein